MDAEQLIDRSAMQALLDRGTGRGVRVAILDTGVDRDHEALEGAVAECREVVPRQGRLQCVEGTSADPVGHGTACAGIIHRLAPHAELISVRVLGKNAGGTLEQLLCGLEWAVEQRIPLINLSLGTLQRRMQERLRHLVDAAYFQGQIIVAAANNRRGVPSYPSQFAALIGVDFDAFAEPMQYRFRLGQPIEIVARGVCVEAPNPGGGFRYFTGTSFACPHVTGLLARLRSEMPQLTLFQAKSLLWGLRSSDLE